MGKVIRFSEYDQYLSNFNASGVKVEGTILDANVIITLSYSPKRFHTRILDFITKKLQNNGVSLYTTVNTTLEYLEFHRRLLLTEALRTVIQTPLNENLSNKKKQIIRAQSSILEGREKHQGADPIFNDREIKKIREVFFNSGQTGINLWKQVCQLYLKKQLEIEFNALNKLKITYLSINNEDQKNLFNKKITWENAITLCADIGAGFSDCMILNALQATSLQFSVSLDVDLGHSVMANTTLKDVVMPDEIVDKL